MHYIKKWKGLFLTTFVVMVIAIACKPDVPTMFSQSNGVYFNAQADSILYTFAQYPNKTTDTVMIPVMVLGNPVSHDRIIKIDTVLNITDTTLNAVSGVHYKLLPPYIMPADSVSVKIPVVVYKTGQMDSVVFSVRLQLKADTTFSIGLSSKAKEKLKIGYLMKPATWGDVTGTVYFAGQLKNFGTWTPTKYRVIINALYNSNTGTSITEFPVPGGLTVYASYLAKVQAYIRENYPGNVPGATSGATLRDPAANNKLVWVGDAVNGY